MPKVWRILSIDGGGIRGIIPAVVLGEIERRSRRRISELFDFIAGTSTGGILTLGLTMPNYEGNPAYTARDMLELYVSHGAEIFHNPASWLVNVLKAKYKSKGIKSVLEGVFEGAHLSEALTNVLICCYDIEHRAPHLFKSRWAQRNRRYDFLMRDVAQATSAAPTFFDPVKLENRDFGDTFYLVDGGVFANNPAMHAFVEVNTVMASPDDDFLVVSIGTGHSSRRLTRKEVASWGYAQWSRPMLELVSESISQSVHEQMRYLLPPHGRQRYYRFEAELRSENEEALDNVSETNISTLMASGLEVIRDKFYSNDMDRLCEHLLELLPVRGLVSVGAHHDGSQSSIGEAVKIDQIDSSTAKDHQIAICYAQEDKAIIEKLSQSLANCGVEAVYERFALGQDASMRRVVVDALEDSRFALVAISPNFLMNDWVPTQMVWLYQRVMGGNSLILPITHKLTIDDVFTVVHQLGWHNSPASYLKNLIQLSKGDTNLGLERLAELISRELHAWAN